ncbi:MAG: nucleotidyl transferase AbiEii/AbiGii toxin family protein [Candidatus Kapabacteria bacterium]|nr:nucleotidyl transferase AbiEii/AbiGii toxin family protein [Candidatus Kapabacteria bacterium]
MSVSMEPEANFLWLDPEERADILQTLALELGRSATVLEKDVWVCWILSKLFSLPLSHRLAFKGGTSLSKVYGLIHRFSEDIDITVDHRDFGVMSADEHRLPSRSQVDKRNKQLRDHLRDFVTEHVLPALRRHIVDELPPETAGITWADPDRIFLRYQSVIRSEGSYIPDQVLLELGSRNPAEPVETHHVTSDIAHLLSDLILPSADVQVLSPKRTFWEKATLIHAVCIKKPELLRSDRLSRHWYDLSLLADSKYGNITPHDIGLLQEVVRHKDAFYLERGFSYTTCLNGSFKLIPDGITLEALSRDYNAMVNAGMFTLTPPTFESITKRLVTLQEEINELVHSLRHGA